MTFASRSNPSLVLSFDTALRKVTRVGWLVEPDGCSIAKPSLALESAVTFLRSIVPPPAPTTLTKYPLPFDAPVTRVSLTHMFVRELWNTIPAWLEALSTTTFVDGHAVGAHLNALVEAQAGPDWSHQAEVSDRDVRAVIWKASRSELVGRTVTKGSPSRITFDWFMLIGSDFAVTCGHSHTLPGSRHEAAQLVAGRDHRGVGVVGSSGQVGGAAQLTTCAGDGLDGKRRLNRTAAAAAAWQGHDRSNRGALARASTGAISDTLRGRGGPKGPARRSRPGNRGRRPPEGIV